MHLAPREEELRERVESMIGDAMGLVARTADVLLANGQTTEGTRIAVSRLALALGHPVEFAARWGAYTLRTSEGTFSGDALPTGIDIARVEATEAVVEAACADPIGCSEALARLDLIRRSAPVALARFAPMAAAGAAALAIIFGAEDWATLCLIAASAGFGAVARRAASHASDNPFLQPLVASLLAGLVGGLAHRCGVPVTDRLVIVCPCMVLVPGPHFLNGAIDLARGRIPIGAGRVGLALLIVAAICGGLIAGLALTGSTLPPAGDEAAVPLAQDVVAAGVAVAAYGSFFNMPWRLVPVPVILGMAAHGLHWALLEHGASAPFAAFGATFLVGAATAPIADRFRVPFGASAFAAVVSLVPGLLMFETASGAWNFVNLGRKADPAALLPIIADGAAATMIIAAMAIGLILPKLTSDAIRTDRRWTPRRA